MSLLRKSTSKFMTIFIIGLVVMAFTFTGYESMKGSPDTIAKVGSTPIKLAEFQQEYTRQINFYKQLFGGKDLTKSQIENFKIKDAVIRNIAQRKISLNLSQEIGIGYSNQEVKNQIKKLPYFLTNNQFDLTKYKALLRANNYTPTTFEENIKNDIMMKKFQAATKEILLSETLVNQIKGYKKNNKTFNMIKIEKEKLKSFIKISSNEIKKYLTDEKNKNRTLSLFNERKPSLSSREQVKARHILLKANSKNDKEIKAKADKLARKLTNKNFASMANKYTEDPSGKGKGGKLGWFEKGKMVPAFEKVAFTQKKNTISAPVKTTFGYHIILVEGHKKAKTAQYKNFEKTLARELLAKSKTKELDQLVTKVSNDFKKLIQRNNKSALKSLNKKYKFTTELNKTVNLFDGLTGAINLEQKRFLQIFKDNKNYHQEKVSSGLILISVNNKTTNVDEKTLDKDITQLQNILSRKTNQAYISELMSSQKVVVFKNFRI